MASNSKLTTAISFCLIFLKTNENDCRIAIDWCTYTVYHQCWFYSGGFLIFILYYLAFGAQGFIYFEL